MKFVSIKKLLLSLFLLSSLGVLQAQQTQPNPDDVPVVSDGPIKVLTERPTSTQKTGQTLPPTFLDRVRLGGSFGLGLGSITNIDVSPMAGLQLTEKMTIGAGITYQYIRYNLYGIKTSTSTYGARAFMFYNIFDGFNVNGELESLSREYFNNTNNTNNRTMLNSVLMGGSYSQSIGGRFVRSVNMMVLYNFSYNNHMNPTNPFENIYPTSSPIIFRVTFF
jgi:hypothetical protein